MFHTKVPMKRADPRHMESLPTSLQELLTQTEVQCTCSVAKCTLHVNRKLNSVAAVYTAHAVYTASTLFCLRGHAENNEAKVRYTAYCSVLFAV